MPGPSGPRAARDVPALLAAVQASDPGRPRLTWYGPDGDRVELSARVLATWVAKTANLLVDELDVQPGAVVALDLPPHWRTAVWALAAWSVGASVSAVADGSTDVVVTTAPADVTTPGPEVLAVPLAALARRFDGDLAGALDYAAVVTGFGDAFSPTGPLDHAALLAEGRDTWPDDVRLLAVGALDLSRDLLASLLADGSLVLCRDEPAASVVEAERVTARSAPGD